MVSKLLESASIFICFLYHKRPIRSCGDNRARLLTSKPLITTNRPPITPFAPGIGKPSRAFSTMVNDDLKELLAVSKVDGDREKSGRHLSRFRLLGVGDGLLDDVDAMVV